MPSSFSHPIQEYRYPYSAFALGVLSANDLQAEIIKAIQQEPSEYEAAYTQLPILVSQYGLSKEQANLIIARLQSLNIPLPENHRNALRYFVSQMEEIHHTPRAPRRPIPTAVLPDTPDAPTPLKRPNAEPLTGTVTKEEAPPSQRPEAGILEETTLEDDLEIEDNLEIEGDLKKAAPPETLSAEALAEGVSAAESLLAEEAAAESKNNKHKQRLHTSSVLALLGIGFLSLLMYSLQTPSYRLSEINTNDTAIDPTSMDPIGTQTSQVTAQHNERENEREEEAQRQLKEALAQKKLIEEARAHSEMLQSWLDRGTQLAEQFHIGPPEEPERALYYLEKLKQEAPQHEYTAQLLFSIAKACEEWATTTLTSDEDAEMHRIYLLRAEHYRYEAKAILSSASENAH